MEYLMKNPSEEWTVVPEEKEKEPEIIEDTCSYTDDDEDFGTNVVDDSDVEAEQEVVTPDMHLASDYKEKGNTQLGEEQRTNILNVPIPYEFPRTNETPLETEIRSSGRVVVEIVGPVKTGKSSLAQSLASMLSTRGWYIKDSEVENEITILQRIKSDMTLTIVGAISDQLASADTRNLNICLLALPPHHVDPTIVSDLAANIRHRNYDVVLPVICKVDSMTSQELHSYASDLTPFLTIVLGVKLSEVYGVVCKERVYSWGSVSPCSSISQLSRLCDVLENHLQLDPADGVETYNFCETQVNDEEYSCCLTKCKGRSLLLASVLTASAIYAWKLACAYQLVPQSLVDLCTFETLLLLLIFTPGGSQKEYGVFVGIALAAFWRLAEDTRQTEVYNMSVALQQISFDNENYLSRLNYCEANLGVCTDRYVNVSTRLYETADRLVQALEFCGSWCLGI